MICTGDGGQWHSEASCLPGATRPRTQPAYFADLQLDRVVSAVIAERDEFGLQGLFHESLHDVEAVRYRQLVIRDLERDEVRERVIEFGRSTDGARSFKITEGRPLPTSYGEDSHRKVFGPGHRTATEHARAT
jgi:hypothetical protein